MKKQNLIIVAIIAFVYFFVARNPLKQTPDEKTTIDTIQGIALLEASSWNDSVSYEIVEGVMINDTFYITKEIEDSTGINYYPIDVPDQFIKVFVPKE